MAEKADTEVEEAGQVFLLMKKDYRISRNVRLAWFLSNLYQSISSVPESELGLHDDELEVVSVIPHGWQPDEPVRPGPFLLVPSTWVTFLARQYRFVIELDLSPSTGIVDDSTEEIIFDEIFHSLSRCLLGLLRPFLIPGSNVVFKPEIYVTIQAYSSIIGLQSHQVLVQGCRLEEQKLPGFLQHVHLQLGAFENKIAEMLQQQYRPHTQDCIPQYANQQPGKKMGVSMVTADIGLVSMIRQGILALQLLPANSNAGIIVITDGVTSVPDIAVCETLLNQLRSGTIACSFVQVGGVYSYDCSFGYVPNVELMKFIGMATLGSYLSSCPELESGQTDMNVYHKAFLPYSFMRTGEALNPEYYCGSQHKLFNEHLVSASSNPALATRRRKHAEKEVHADIISVVSVRLREGYSIREIRITKAMLEVKLVLLWKHNMRVEYLAMAPWPLDSSKRSTRVEVVMEGSYDILHDISCTLKKPITSMYRTSVIRRFWNTLQSISQTDQMLVHLKSFDSVPEHFKIPESTKNGVPLFYIPPGSTTPVLSLQHSDSDSSHSQFASYWKPILSMDANVWQRWLHVHRIVLLLEHDMPLPKHLHTPGNNGRYSTVQCRISHTALTSLLRDWSSFVLVESYSYVKLMLSDASQTPSSFCVVRIIWKAPCMVLRLGFPLGTPTNCRNKMVEELRDRILQLRFPYRVQSKDSTPRVKRKIFGISSPSKSPPPQVPPPAFSDRCCLVLLHKPLEKLLIKYDKMPLDYRTPFILNLESPTQHTSVSGPLISSRSASSTLASLSRYFYHQRWIWSVQSGLATTVPTTAMAQILSTLTEIRLSEGFHFASSGEGIINMVLEVPIQSDCIGEGSIEKHSCIIQYILFPPHVTSTKDSFSTDEDNDTEVEAIEQDMELHLVSECWVEPQSGVVMGTSESWKHLHGLIYSEIPQSLFPRDQSCINIMLTFEYIVQLCQNKDGGSPILTKAERTEPGESGGLYIREVPFHFDLMKMLPKCQQIELFFLTLSGAEADNAAQDSSLPNDMLLSLFHGCLQSDVNDQEIPLYEQDHQTFMEQVLQRDRDGHTAPFSCTREEPMRQPSTSETVDSTPLLQNGQREANNSASTLQSPCPTEETDDSRALANGSGPPQWRCYARLVSPQHFLLTFLPATFSDVQKLMTSSSDLSLSTEGSSLCNSSQSETLPLGAVIPTLSITPAVGNGQEAEHKRETHISFNRQSSMQDVTSSRRLRCPVYVYNCSLEALREQLVSPRQQRLGCDIFFSEFRQESVSWEIFQEVKSRSMSQERPTAIPFIHHRQKELVNHCNLLQEHYHQCYVKGLFKTLQQSLWVSHQDLLTAVDYCEEQLQEIDITNFLMTLCGHLRGFRDTQVSPRLSLNGRVHKASFRIGSLEQEDEVAARDGSVLHSESSVDTEECVEQELHVISTPEPSVHPYSEFQLSVLDSGHPCEVSLDLHRVIQDKFLAIGSLHFKTVPSNPHYFFYCPSSQRREENAAQDTGDRKPSEEMDVSEAEQATEEGNTSAGGIVTESDPDLEVEYREHSDNAESPSESETVNQDDDSFSVLGDSLNGHDLPEHEMPPLFVHLICSVTHKHQHGSMPVLTLPTCLGEVIRCLENSETLQSISLGDLSVMLDIYVLTLPLEIEGVNEDSQHTRYTSESSVSFPRSPAQPSSYRSDEEIPPTLERFPSNVEQSYSALSRLPAEHRQAIEVTMSEIRWLLEDELVSALRHSRVISRSILRKVLSHVCESEGRPHCNRELVQLQFVFGPENSLQKFKEEFRRLSLPGYQLNEEEEDYYYVSLSRHHAQRAEHTSAQHLGVQGHAVWHETDVSKATESVDEELLGNGRPEDKPGAEDPGGWAQAALVVSDSEVSSIMSGISALEQGGNSATEASLSDRGHTPPKTSSEVSLPESVQSGNLNSAAGLRQRPSRVQSLVSSHGSMDSDHLGYDAGSSDSECEDALISEQDSCCPVMPKFWLIVKIHQDRVEVCTHASVGVAQEVVELGESQRLHQLVVRKVGEICRVVNQRLLLQDLHDTHLCNTLLVAESEEDIWKSESPYATYRQRMLVGEDFPGEESYQPRDYLAATMQFIPGHFACDTVWSTVIHIHPRLKMGPNMGVSRAIQSLRSVLNAFSVVNRKNMFVYQERATKSVFYLRLSETSGNGRLWDMDLSQSLSRSLALSRSQEPIFSEDLMGSNQGSRLSLDLSSSRNSDSSRPVGQMDKHILLQVHGVGEAGSEITDDLVKVLRKRLDEATLDIITVMLQRNCKLTPADVEFIQPRGTPPTEVLLFTIPQTSLPCLQAMAYYLRQNLLIFLHTPKYTDSNGEHHFQHYYHSTLPELDLFLYNKPGGQGTGGKGIACIALSFVDQHGALVTQAYGERTGPPLVCPSTTSHLLSVSTFESLTKVSKFTADSAPDSSAPLTLVRFDVWEKGNISSSQLSDRLANSLRHALCDVIIEFHILQMPLCVDLVSAAEQEVSMNGKAPSQSLPDMKGLAQSSNRSRPSPVQLPPSSSPSSTDPSTPPSKSGRRSFWDMLSKPDNAELGPPKTTDDIVSERTEEPRTRRRHKTESLKAPCYPDRPGLSLEHAQRKRQAQLEEGDVGTLHPLYSHTCLQWMNFMNQLGCPSVQLCSVHTISRFLLPSILTELFGIITSLASDTSVRVFEKITGPEGPAFVPYSTSHNSPTRPAAAREMTLLGRNFRQWRYNTEQAQKGSQRFEAMELGSAERPLDLSTSVRGLVPRQRFLLIEIQDKKLTLYTYNWSPDLGASLSRSLVRLIQWQNARAHVVHCLLNQKMGLFHHYCFTDTPWHEDNKQDPNPFLNSTLEVDALIRSPTPPPHKEQTRLGTSGRGLPSLHYPPDIVPFDEVLRDVMPVKPMHLSSELDTVSRHGAQFLDIKSTERREVEKQLKIENLFVTWQQRSAQSNMPISAADLDTLKQSARMVHYCATPLLFDPSFQVQVQNDQGRSEGKKRHRSNDSGTSGRDRSHSCDSADMPPSKAKDEPWLQELCTAFMQQYIQYLQSTGFILVQLRPASPARSIARIRAVASLAPENRTSKPKSEGSPKSTAPTVTIYHLQRALPGGIVLMELSFQGCYFCVKQYALECSRIPMGQSVNSQLSMLFTEECDKVRDLMHVHSFSYDFHLRVVHQYLLGSSMSLRQGYDLTSFLQLFISQHPDIPKYGRNHVYQGVLSVPTEIIAAHQLYNYIADHANTYRMKPLRMVRPSVLGSNGKRSASGEQNEYGLVSIWNSSGSYKDTEGARHHDDFDVSLLVCHSAVPFEEQTEQERHVLRLRFYVIMTSQRELFPRLTADMRRFKKPPRLQRDDQDPDGASELGMRQRMETESQEDPREGEVGRMGATNLYYPHLFPLLGTEVSTAQRQLVEMVQLAKCHCRRDNLWKRLYLLEPLSSDKLRLGKLNSGELKELLDAVHGRSVAEVDPQLDFLLSMSVQWYQSLIKVLLNRFPQSCRHFHNPENGTQYLVVLNQKFTDCFVLVFLDSHSGKTSLKVVFREPFPEQPQNSDSPLPQLVSTYHHLESVINTACFNLWSGLL